MAMTHNDRYELSYGNLTHFAIQLAYHKEIFAWQGVIDFWN